MSPRLKKTQDKLGRRDRQQVGSESQTPHSSANEDEDGRGWDWEGGPGRQALVTDSGS